MPSVDSVSGLCLYSLQPSAEDPPHDKVDIVNEVSKSPTLQIRLRWQWMPCSTPCGSRCRAATASSFAVWRVPVNTEARIGRNPRTGKEVRPARPHYPFKPGKDLQNIG